MIDDASQMLTISFFFESRRGSPVCITPKGNCATSPVDARKQSSRQRIALPGNTVQYNQAHRSVPGMPQPIRPHSTSARASGRYSRDTATRSTLLAADPGPNCPGILIPLLVFLRRVTPLYNLVVGGPVRGPHGGTHPKAVSRGQTHPASGPFLPRHAALKARPLEQSGPHTGILTHRVNTTGYPW